MQKAFFRFLLCAGCLSPVSLPAALICAEGFDYAEGAIGISGGQGWTDVWSGGAICASPGFAYSNLVVSGTNRYSGTGTHYRTIDRAPGTVPYDGQLMVGGEIGNDGRTVWLGFLGRRTAGTGWGGISLWGDAGEQHFFGNNGSSDFWGIIAKQDGGEGFHSSAIHVLDPTFVLIRMDFNKPGDATSSDTTRMWLNPPIGGGERDLGIPNVTVFRTNLLFTTFTIGSDPGTTWDFDEIRMGTTLEDVAPAMLLPSNAVPSMIIAEDGFDYPTGAIASNGGQGWSVAWPDTALVVAPGMTYSNLFLAGTNRYSGVNHYYRGINVGVGTPAHTLGLLNANNLIGSDGTDCWMSFIAKKTLADGWAGISLFGGNDDEQHFIGTMMGNRWMIVGKQDAGEVYHDSGKQSFSDSFILLKFEFSATDDTTKMWVNPDISAGEAGIGAPDVSCTRRNLEFHWVRIASDTAFDFDELRIGSRYEAVVPAPGSLPPGPPPPPEALLFVIR